MCGAPSRQWLIFVSASQRGLRSVQHSYTMTLCTMCLNSYTNFGWAPTTATSHPHGSENSQPKVFKLTTTLPWVRSSTPAKCEIDQMKACREILRTVTNAETPLINNESIPIFLIQSQTVLKNKIGLFEHFLSATIPRGVCFYFNKRLVRNRERHIGAENQDKIKNIGNLVLVNYFLYSEK